MQRALSILILFGISVVSCAATRTRRCVAGSQPFACILPRFDYEPGQDIPIFHLPADVKAVRFVEPYYNTHAAENVIQVYDITLHRQLNSPVAIELTGSQTVAVELAPNLEYADFSDNSIRSVYVRADQTYTLRYLDLNYNSHLRPANVSLLVNLETLHLSRCNLETVSAEMFANLNRLAHLSLAANHFSHIDLKVLPSSLVMLRLDRNWMHGLEYATAQLPLLEDLNIEFNELTDLNISVLLGVAPKLRLFSIGRNPLRRNVLNGILEKLDQHKIAYYSMEHVSDEECDSDERRYRGACIPASVFTLEWTDWVELVLFLCVLVALTGGAAYGSKKLWDRYRSRVVDEN